MYRMVSRVNHMSKDSSLRNTQEHTATLINLVLLFNPAVYSYTLLIKTSIKVILSQNSYCNTIGEQWDLIEWATKLACSRLLWTNSLVVSALSAWTE